MSYQEMVTEIRQLSTHDRLSLLEELTRLLRQDLAGPGRQGSTATRVRGMLKPDGPPPSAEESGDDYTRYLIEKYA